ncbi:Uncharacterised protein [Bordetella pertussis]|nr:Uncharacterised protein [Bordetella pertussis]CFO34801.1 Uncharacterised protein [Bordetella pertussis]CFP03138.1 Uncharacterised protein [Bordetella pertussis]CFP53200.1 Uncharacterised protein [Bordetella pertussis]CFT81983.1 Uncharacterised protein [Bordetella pertussis]
MQPRDAIDDDAVGAVALDARAHLDEQLGQVDHFGFARGIFQHGLAFGQHRRHQQVLGAGDGDHVGADRGALQARGARHHEAVLDLDLGAQRRQPLDVLVDRPLADRAAARQADAGLAEAGQQRAQHQDRGAHGLDQLVRRFQVVDLVGLQGDGAVAGAFGAHAHAAQQAQRGRGVVQLRHIAQHERLGGEQAGAQDGQGRVLGARDGDFPTQGRAAGDAQFVHQLPALAYSAGVSVRIDSAWISAFMRSPSAA